MLDAAIRQFDRELIALDGSDLPITELRMGDLVTDRELTHSDTGRNCGCSRRDLAGF